MFIKKEEISAAFESAVDFALYFLLCSFKTGIFFEQFYSWLPLYRILLPLLPGELLKYSDRVDEIRFSYKGDQTDKLLQGISSIEIERMLVGQRIFKEGWGNDSKDGFSRFSPTVQVLNALALKRGKEFIDSGFFRDSFGWVVKRWKEDLYEFEGLSFKGSIFLCLLSNIHLKGGNELIKKVDREIIVDTLDYIKKTQNQEGGWGFFFRNYKDSNLDELMTSLLSTSVTGVNLIGCRKFFSDFNFDFQEQEAIEMAIRCILNKQAREGFWPAETLETFLKILGWNIKFLHLFKKSKQLE